MGCLDGVFAGTVRSRVSSAGLNRLQAATLKAKISLAPIKASDIFARLIL
jgi:hypothetical protein